MLITYMVLFILSLLMIWGAKKLEKLAHALENRQPSHDQYQTELLEAVKQIQENTSPKQVDTVQETLEDIKSLKQKQADRESIEDLISSLDDPS